MAESTEIENSFNAFLSGRMPFEELAGQVADHAARSDAAHAQIQTIIRDLVNAGRFPPDLAALIRSVLGQVVSGHESGADSGDPPDQDPDDPPTVPRPRDGGPLPQAVAPGSSGSLRDKVDTVVLAAMADRYTAFRDGRNKRESSDERQLGTLLRDVSGLRVRREADRARSGKTTTLDLESQRGDRKQLDIGSYLKDRFVIDRILGSGGMSTVYAAVDRRRLEAGHDNPYIALKVLAESLKRNPYALQLLEAETRKAQSLAHPNIVTVFDFDRDQSDVFIVMEMLDGCSLAEALKAKPMRYSDLETARPVLAGTIAALAYAHSQSVVHADVKPANIFVTSDGRAKVLDFGIATARNLSGIDPAELNAFTRTYASPEMIDGKGREPADDVFSLGVVAYLMLTGEHPFLRRTADAARDEGMKPDRIVRLNKRQWQAMESALAFERADRPTMIEFGEGLYTEAGRGFFARLFSS